MPVQFTNPQYDKYLSEWRKCRDAVAGQRAVHDAGELYLPKLDDQLNENYQAYKNRALFYEATGRTVQGLDGMVFRKPANIEPNTMAEFLEDVTATGVNLESFSKFLVRELLTVNRGGILLDFTNVDTTGMTVAEARAAGSRPFMKFYAAEAIINWQVGNRIEQVRLKEEYQAGGDEFTPEFKEQIRVLDLDESGLYVQRIFRKSEVAGKDEWVEVEVIQPMVNGNRLDYIPWIFCDVDGQQGDIQQPHLMGLVNVNLSHYKNSADLEHGAHFTGLPTPVVTGFQSYDSKGDSKEMKIGSQSAWIIPDPSATAFYLEFEGKGLDTLKELMQSKEDKMASLGAQMLTPESRRNEAAETAAIRHLGENSILSSVAQTVSDLLNDALEIIGDWLNLTPATIELNTDFLPIPMTPQMLQQLVASWQSGAISSQTLFENLKAGEIIDSKKSYEDEQDEINNDPSVAAHNPTGV